VHFGIIASGEKLVDSSDFIKTLKNQKAQLIGGEMEGSGISAVCQRKKHDWIMFKSICDWGENKTKEFQAESAKRAAIYCIRVIRYISTVQA
jgi:nucleoside phosphorylase